MGRDKASLQWGNGSLLDHMVQLLSTVVDRVRVAGRGDLPDRVAGRGPMGGILTALETTETEENLVVAVDLPLLTPEFLRQFHARFLASSHPLFVCKAGETYPLCLGIRRTLKSEVARRIETGNLALHSFINQSDAEVLETGFDPSIFANANTPEDWVKLQES
jgi:molybdopterin-guanine dinucleotide biosynthesis protein A